MLTPGFSACKLASQFSGGEKKKSHFAILLNVSWVTDAGP